MKKRIAAHIGLIVIFALALGFFDLPYDRQTQILPTTPASLEEQKVNLGLDLQGGTQLDYKLDLRRVEEADREQIIEGVLEVINRRVNGLGVTEPLIYRSSIADEEHIVVELAGIKDLDEAKATVGKTIQLEFKEEGEATLSEEELLAIETTAQSALDRIVAGEDFDAVGEEEQLANSAFAIHYPANPDFYEEEGNINEAFLPYLKEMQIGNVTPELIRASDGYTFDADANLVAMEGYFLIKLVDKREVEKEVTEGKEVEASHLLISYEGAERAGDDVTRTKEEAETLAEEVQQRAASGEDFAALVTEFSDEAGSEETGGNLGYFGEGAMVSEFEEAAFAMAPGEISNVVETDFGYHVIHVTNVKESTSETVTVTEYNLAKILFLTVADPWKETGLTGEHFVRADVEFSQTYTPYVSITFDDEGAALFEEITSRNVGKPIAIFVGGDLISAPNVNEPITGGRAQISGSFTVEEASELARDLNTGAIPAPIVLVGQYTIGASLGEEALASSLKAGIFGIVILMLYMVLYYRLPGLLANLALLIYAATLIFFIKVALPLGAALLISVIIFGFIVSAILKSSDSGWEKLISFTLGCFVLFFFTYLLATPVVLTLAGIAGVILSIGMAVDANILIFERIREELRNKRPLSSAIEVGFDRAWSSIRDSNFSSLITCAILIYFGSSIIKGFAVNLALGILISMFTAITITRTFLRALVGTKVGENKWLMGIPRRGHWNLPIIKARKLWFTLSGAVVIASLVLIPMNGLKLGMDFTGGTLLELQFEQPVDNGAIVEEIQTIEQELLTTPTEANLDTDLNGDLTETDETSSSPELSAYEEDRDIPVDFGTPLVVSSGENSVLVRMKHISNESHAALLAGLEERFGPLEETRFTTIGPTIGSTMKEKAIVALAIALVFIVFYIAFAFRHIPRHLSPWRFGFAAIAALVHDVVITVGVFTVLGTLYGVEIDALFVTALLTVLGFSVHDTIVVFDRVRENLKTQRTENFEEIANAAVNQTLSRSINTSLSTLITVLILFLLGAESIHWFLFALLIGIGVGTYSSIFVATPLLVWWDTRKTKKS